MKELTVRQIAAISGVTVRTLHHYDEIGLLKPASVGANGYRYYGRSELLRLQRILFHRELGVPLSAIAELLDLEGTDQITVLRQHRAKLETELERYLQLIDTIDRTIEELNGGRTMANADLYKGFSPEKQAGYEAWLIEKYGEPMRTGIERSRKAWSKRSAAEQQAFIEASGRDLHEIEQGLAGALRNGVAATSDAVDALIDRHRSWVAMMWGCTCSTASYSGLADLYLSHPDFVARYEAIEPGFAEYLAGAMKLYANRHGGSGPPAAL
ncbi:MAG TPA: MerR family transcriptional regulator [Steroidobacteraceae bacterium]|nr:MerR family transcriptional regulator [Steroidobacteraceae bacterium]